MALAHTARLCLLASGSLVGSSTAATLHGESSSDIHRPHDTAAAIDGQAGFSLLEESEHIDTAFRDFAATHGRDLQHGTEEYQKRKALFHQRLLAVRAHNTKPDRLWNAAVTKFSDHTEAERQAVRGYRSSLSRRSGASLIQTGGDPSSLPESKSWTHLKVAKNIRDQGSCGSCWAITTTSVLEAHYEIYSAKGGATKTFSPQQTLECTPNPHQCGGTGGCEGATVELGMDWIVKNSVATEEEVPYKAQDGKCSLVNRSDSGSSNVPDRKKAVPSGDSFQVLLQPSVNGGAAIGLMSYHTLERNVDYPLAEALVKYGPVAVSAAASAWFEYESGVFDGCEKDAIVDHAITLYGYGKDDKRGVKYWHIRNSWGRSWGENGYIRLLRHDSDKTYCGTDNDPSQGLGCKGGPSKVTVCGMCGILFDSVVPYFSGSPGFRKKGDQESAGSSEGDAKTGETPSGSASKVPKATAPKPPPGFDPMENTRFQAEIHAKAAPSLIRMEAKRHQ